ncbi:MAG: ParB/RepB/Spo0J family partition protein [Alphaproteobacteria bacterium]|nr:ParB/RepB/Spo0J family partition protein [Alphaproteobacteria bacterium]
MLDNDLDELLNDTPAQASPHKRKSLGRGLGALLGDDIEEQNTSTKPANSNLIDISKIKACKYQPRTEFDKEALNALAESIKEKGVLQPLLVRQQGGEYEIIAGERRWRAAQIAGLTEIPVVIKDFEDKEVLEAALVENLLREDLSAIEEAEALQRLMDEFSHTQEALSKIVCKSRSHVANTLRLLSLPEDIKKMVKEGSLSAGHARSLVGQENALALAKEAVAKGLSVRQVEDLVAAKKEPKSSKPRAEKNNDIAEIEQELVKSLGLRIKITPNKQGGGKVVLQYSSVAELDMIIETLENRKNKTHVSNTVFKEPEESQGSEKFSIKFVD